MRFYGTWNNAFPVSFFISDSDYESFYQEKGISSSGGRVNLFLRLNCSKTISNIGKSKVEYENTN